MHTCNNALTLRCVQALTLAALAAAGAVDVYEHRHTTNRVSLMAPPRHGGCHPLSHMQVVCKCCMPSLRCMYGPSYARCAAR